MKEVCRIGLDIAKLNFQVHGVDQYAKDVFNKKLKRNQVLPFFANLPACLIGIEACAGAHYWAREIEGLGVGHTVRLISPRHVKPFVINNKTDAADARAICEVVGRPSTRFVNVKTVEQQDISAWHRIRELAVKERTAVVNQTRALLGEQGIIIPQGIAHVRHSLPVIIEDLENKLSLSARDYMSKLYNKIVGYDEEIDDYTSRIMAYAKSNEACQRILQIPGVGPVTATAIIAHVGDAKQFKNGRAFAACLGLTPREHSSGGKQKLLGITKRGNDYIRCLLIQGARVALRYGLVKAEAEQISEEQVAVLQASEDPAVTGKALTEAIPRLKWMQNLTARRGKHIAAVALANKTARIIWAMLSSGETYNPATA